MYFIHFLYIIKLKATVRLPMKIKMSIISSTKSTSTKKKKKIYMIYNDL